MNPRTRLVVTRGLASATLVLVVLALVAGNGRSANGPVPLTDPISLEYEFAAGSATTWGMTFPPAGATTPATVVAVEPQGVAGLDVIDVRACDFALPGCAIVNAAGWPLNGVATVPVAGITLPATGGPGELFQLLIGVRRQSSAAPGSIDSVKIVYRIGDKTYEVTEPWSLKILAPGALASPT